MEGANGSEADYRMLLGQLLDRSDTQIWWMQRVDSRLEHGDLRMTQTQIAVAKLEAAQAYQAEEINRLRAVKAEEISVPWHQRLREIMETIQTVRLWVTWAVIITMSVVALVAPAEIKTIAVKWLQANVSAPHEGP